jgi:cytochrome c-type biogenesis protein CcmH
MSLLALIAALGCITAASAQGDLDAQTRQIAHGLRCAVCQNLSVADSNADLAQEMRQIIREQLGQGKSRAEIESYFVERYGESVLLDPPKRGFNLLIWGWPILILLVGLAVVGVAMTRWTRSRPETVPEPTAEEMARYDAAFKEELKRHAG